MSIGSDSRSDWWNWNSPLKVTRCSWELQLENSHLSYLSNYMKSIASFVDSEQMYITNQSKRISFQATRVYASSKYFEQNSVSSSVTILSILISTAITRRIRHWTLFTNRDRHYRLGLGNGFFSSLTHCVQSFVIPNESPDSLTFFLDFSLLNNRV